MSSNDSDISRYFLDVELLLNESLPSPGGSDGATWSSVCVGKLKATWDADKPSARMNITNGLAMDKEGSLFRDGHKEGIDEAWGISLDLCKEHCGRDRFSMVRL